MGTSNQYIHLLFFWMCLTEKSEKWQIFASSFSNNIGCLLYSTVNLLCFISDISSDKWYKPKRHVYTVYLEILDFTARSIESKRI